MSRTPSCEDSDAISARLRELEAERSAIFRCSCQTAIDGHGDVIRVLDQACPVHGQPRPDSEWLAA